MSLKQLKELEATQSRRTDRPAVLPLKDIFVEPDVFQWRVKRYNELNSDAHTLSVKSRWSRRHLLNRSCEPQRARALYAITGVCICTPRRCYLR